LAAALAGLQLGVAGLSVAQDLLEPSAGAGAPTAEAERLPRYQVEILAFAYHAFDPTEEQFERLPPLAPQHAFDPPPMEEIPPAAQVPPGETFHVPPAEVREATEPMVTERLLQSLTPLEPEPTASNEPVGPDGSRTSVEEPFWFRILTAEELELTDAYLTLERLDAYTPLAHGGWVQEGLPEERARPFQLSMLGALNPAGTIQLHVSRFLHLSVDLDYRTRRSQTAAPFSSVGSSLEPLALPSHYELRAQRRTRSGELHYFDHPAFGVLLVVRPDPEEAAESEEDLLPAA
jgi:hypothetical protein